MRTSFEFNNFQKSESLSSHLIRNGFYPRNIPQSDIGRIQKGNTLNDASNPLFITMIDSSYMPAVRNFNLALEKYHLDGNFIVICLDVKCVNLGQSHQLLIWSAFVNASVAKVKVGLIYLNIIWRLIRQTRFEKRIE
jgi:hypothetical protein